MQLRSDQLQQIMPRLTQTQAQAYLPYLNAALDQFQISTPNRVAAFLAQLAHESGELRYWHEIASGQDYEGRKDLGNVNPGDGKRYKGRGPIQITGRANYEKYGTKLGLDLLNHPELLEQPEYGFKAAGAFWFFNGLNTLADTRSEASFKLITKKINGGLNGYAERISYYSRALRALTVPEVEPDLPPAIAMPPELIPLAPPPQPIINPAPAPVPIDVSTTQVGNSVVVEMTPAQDVTPHVSDSKKSVQAGFSAASIVSALTMLGAWFKANSNTVMVAIICITLLAMLFMFRQLVLAYVRERFGIKS